MTPVNDSMPNQMSAIILKSGIVGEWEMKYSYSLNLGGNGVINVIEKYRFEENGVGEISYGDDSGLNIGSIQDSPIQFTFKIDENRICFLTNGAYDELNSLEFNIEADKLTLCNDGIEEIYYKKE